LLFPKTVTEVLKKAGVTPSSSLYEPIITICEPEDLPICFLIVEILLETGEKQNIKDSVNLTILNKVLELCFAGGPKYQQASREIFRLIHEIHSQPNAGTVLILVNHARLERDLKALSKDITIWGLAEVDVVQKSLLEACCRLSEPSSRLLACQEWIMKWRRSGVKVSPLAMDFMTNLHLKEGTAATAVSHVLSQKTNDTLDTCIRVLKSVGVATETGGVDAREERLVWNLIKRIAQLQGVDCIESPSSAEFGEIVKAMGRVGDAKGVQYLYRLVHSNTSADQISNKLPQPSSTIDESSIPITLTEQEIQYLTKNLSASDSTLLQAFASAFTSRLISDLSAAAKFARASESQSAVLTLLKASDTPIQRVADVAISQGIDMSVSKTASKIIETLQARKLAQLHERSTDDPLRWMGPRLSSLSLSSKARQASEDELIWNDRKEVAEVAAKLLVREVKKVQEGKDTDDALASLEKLLGEKHN
jgi:hypothetical protein